MDGIGGDRRWVCREYRRCRHDVCGVTSARTARGGPTLSYLGDGWECQCPTSPSCAARCSAARPQSWLSWRMACCTPGVVAWLSERGCSNTASAPGGLLRPRRGRCVLSLGLSGHCPGHAFRTHNRCSGFQGRHGAPPMQDWRRWVVWDTAAPHHRLRDTAAPPKADNGVEAQKEHGADRRYR